MSEQTEGTRRIFFSAGEPSGDLHAAELIEMLKKLSPEIEISGYGGPKMQEAGCDLLHDLTQLAIMWFGRALLNARKFFKLIADAEVLFAQGKVDAVVLVDFPGFNWMIAKKAKKHGIPVFYFMPPQIWSWASWRVRKMRRLVDYVLCCLPFEKRWFEQNGCNVEYIGHPFFEEVKNRELDQAFLDELRTAIGPENRILTLLPGSRNQEVGGNFDDFISAAQRVCKKCPDVRPIVAAFKDSQKETIEKRLAERGESYPVYVGKTPELIRAAHCCLAVSGSVSLELLANNRPSVIYYKIASYAYFVQRFFRRSRYITLVNLTEMDRGPDAEKLFYKEYPAPVEPSAWDKERMLFPEFLTYYDRSAEVADILVEWFGNDAIIEQKKERLASLLQSLDKGESPVRSAAEFLLTKVSEK